MDNDSTSFDPQFVRNVIESALRLGILFVLLLLAYDIIKPFITPIIWGAIIAIAAFPLVRWLEPKLGGRRGLAATLVTLFFLLALVIPTWVVTDAAVGGLKKASTDLESFALANATQLKELAGKLLRQIGGSLVGVMVFIVSLLIAGGFMTYAESCGTAAHRFFVRVGGLNPGGEWAPLTVATVRSVLQGVIGVAVIQTVLIALGLFVMGVPGAALWTAIILVLAIAQLPARLVPVEIVTESDAEGLHHHMG